MRRILIICLTLISCAKDSIVNSRPDLEYVYYKIRQVNNDGEINYTETRLVRNMTMAPPYSEDTCFNCTVPLLITKFDAYSISGNFIKLDWSCQNEDGIKCYVVCKSKNNKQWLEVEKINKSSGEYTFIDKQ